MATSRDRSIARVAHSLRESEAPRTRRGLVDEQDPMLEWRRVLLHVVVGRLPFSHDATHKDP